MHSDLALLLSVAKGKLRFYKSEVLKDVLYYNCGGKAADGSTSSRPLQLAYAIHRNPRMFGRLPAAPTNKNNKEEPK